MKKNEYEVKFGKEAFDDAYEVILFDKSDYLDAYTDNYHKEKEIALPMKIGARANNSTESTLEIVDVLPETHTVVLRHYSIYWVLSPEDPEEVIWDRAFHGGNVGDQYFGHSYLKVTLRKKK